MNGEEGTFVLQTIQHQGATDTTFFGTQILFEYADYSNSAEHSYSSSYKA